MKHDYDNWITTSENMYAVLPTATTRGRVLNYLSTKGVSHEIITNRLLSNQAGESLAIEFYLTHYSVQGFALAVMTCGNNATV